jgi:hypothetical protein
MAWKFFTAESQVIGINPSRGWNFYTPSGEIPSTGNGGGSTYSELLVADDICDPPELVFSNPGSCDILMSNCIPCE